MALFVTGIFMMLGSLWGGAYAFCALPDEHWAMFPTMMTSVLTFFAGMLLVCTADPKIWERAKQ